MIRRITKSMQDNTAALQAKVQNMQKKELKQMVLQ